jgi:2,4-dichlorophenol 6-monooxygenase
VIETDVLIVGSGPAGSTAALALSTYGIANILISKYGWLANSPRSHVTNQRSFEILRDLGIEADAMAHAIPYYQMPNMVFCTSLVGEELGRVQGWGMQVRQITERSLASPCISADLPQNLLEPVLLGHAAQRGTRVLFHTEYLSLVQDKEGVTATVQNRLSDEVYSIRAKYLIGADGGRSKVAEDIALPMEGSMGIAGSFNIVFAADLSKYVAHRPGLLYLIVQPGLDTNGVGIAIIRTVRPWKEWQLILGYDLNEPEPRMGDTEAIQAVRTVVGDENLPVRIKSANPWTINNQYATLYQSGRVFCMGDAVHRHPPMNGLGSNTSIQDAYNLSWKLALVLKNTANPTLLASYSEERVPVGQQVVVRANKSIEETGPIFEALGLLSSIPGEKESYLEVFRSATEEGARRRQRLREAIDGKNYEFNTHGIEMNQHYISSAVVSEDLPFAPPDFDIELQHVRTTLPGSRLPHVWLQRDGQAISTLDIVGKGKFVVITGIGGECWKAAALRVAQRLGMTIKVSIVGPGRDFTDLYGDWASIRGIEESGCLLIRPDGHIAWRAQRSAANQEHAEASLLHVASKILGRENELPTRTATSALAVD